MSTELDDRIDVRARLHTPRLRSLLGALYGATHDVDDLAARLVGIATDGARNRRPSLQHRDVECELDPMWFQRSSMIGYVAYAELFGGTLKGVAERLDYLAELQITYFHLMKVLRSREGANDGGYAVLDYGDVEPSLGTWSDLESLADELHDRGVALCLDLVMNHTAREHEWARLAQAGSQRPACVFPRRCDARSPRRCCPRSNGS